MIFGVQCSEARRKAAAVSADPGTDGLVATEVAGWATAGERNAGGREGGGLVGLTGEAGETGAERDVLQGGEAEGAVDLGAAVPELYGAGGGTDACVRGDSGGY